MTVDDWFRSRDVAYSDMLEVEDDPYATEEEIESAREAWREVRSFLRTWRRSESDEWRAEWREEQKRRISETLEEFRKED